MSIRNILPDGLLLSVFLFIIVSSIVGNVFIVVSFAVSKHMKSVTNVFIVSLAISDMVTGTVVSAFAWGQTLYPGHPSRLACDLPVYVELACMATIVFGHLAVGFDRYLAVMKPMKKYLTLTKAVCTVVVIWVASVLYSSLMMAELSLTDRAREQEFCNLFIGKKEDNLVFHVLNFVVLFVLPLCALSYMYCHVGHYLWGKRCTVTGILRRKRKVVKFLAISLASFILSWCPFYVLDIIGDVLKKTARADEKDEVENSKAYVVIRFCFAVMALSNCFFTPFIYIIYFPSIRADTKVAICRAFRGHAVAFPVPESVKGGCITSSTLTLWTTSHYAKKTSIFYSQSASLDVFHETSTRTNVGSTSLLVTGALLQKSADASTSKAAAGSTSLLKKLGLQKKTSADASTSTAAAGSTSLLKKLGLQKKTSADASTSTAAAGSTSLPTNIALQKSSDTNSMTCTEAYTDARGVATTPL